MGAPERFLKLASDMVDRVSSEEGLERARRSARRGVRRIVKLLKLFLWMALAAIVIPVAMITAGLLLGPRGTEGLIAAPLAVLVSWALILYFGLRKPRVPALVARSDVAGLPARSAEWLDHERHLLPEPAQPRIDSILSVLDALKPALKNQNGEAPAVAELRRLLGDELPELIHGYQRVPAALQSQPLHGGPSPAERLVDALGTIEEELVRLTKRLAADDLHALATQQRYLELKYRDGGSKSGG